MTVKELLKAIAAHKTATTDASFDGPGIEAKIPNDTGEANLRKMFAWIDPEGDPEKKASYKFIHHMWDGSPGAANTRACTSGIGVLNGGRGGTTIPSADKQGVWDHLAKHIKDSGADPPELKALDGLELRRARATALRNIREIRAMQEFELREAHNGDLKLTGYASVFDVRYDRGFYTESVKPGAFDKTLSEDPDVQLLINHEGLPLARTKKAKTLHLETDSIGLAVDASLDHEDPEVQNLKRKMDRGLLDEMSFAFWAKRNTWNDDYTERDIVEASIDKGDVSIVNYGANPATAGASLRKRAQEQGLSAGVYLDALKEMRQGKTLSADSMAALQKVLDLIASADESIDDAQDQLSTFMDVPNPDPEMMSNSMSDLELRYRMLDL